MKTDLNILKGILLHPFKALYFVLYGGASQYDILSISAQIRAERKAFYRSMYMESLTRKPLKHVTSKK